MEGRVLVAYASRTGTAAEVAEALAQVLRRLGFTVDVRSVQEVHDLGPYGAVVLGSAAQRNRLLPEAVSFARRHEAALRSLKVAFFAVGMTMQEDTPAHRALMLAYLAPLLQIMEPVSVGLFAGRLEYAQIRQPWRLLFGSAGLAEGDYRNWQAIRAWAQEVALELEPAGDDDNEQEGLNE